MILKRTFSGSQKEKRYILTSNIDIGGLGRFGTDKSIFYFFIQPIQYIMATIVWIWDTNIPHAYGCSTSHKSLGVHKSHTYMAKEFS